MRTGKPNSCLIWLNYYSWMSTNIPLVASGKQLCEFRPPSNRRGKRKGRLNGWRPVTFIIQIHRARDGRTDHCRCYHHQVNNTQIHSHARLHLSTSPRSTDTCSVPRDSFWRRFSFWGPLWPTVQIPDSRWVLDGFGISITFWLRNTVLL